jgi:FkbM family methyltransferase
VLRHDLLRAPARLYPFSRGRGALVNLMLRRLDFPPGTIRRLNGGPEIELIPGQYCSKVIWLFGIDEPREERLFRRLVPKDGVVIDVGANIGQYTLLAAMQTGSGGRVYAFEPDPLNAGALERSISRNGFGERVDLLRFAVADRSGEAILRVRADRTRSHLLRDEVTCRQSDAISVRTITLDEFAEERGLDRLDVVKVDAEGADLAVLRGAEHAIRRFRPGLLMVEHDPDSLLAYGERPEALPAFVEALGYNHRFVNARGIFRQAPIAAGSRGGNLICTPAG